MKEAIDVGDVEAIDGTIAGRYPLRGVVPLKVKFAAIASDDGIAGNGAVVDERQAKPEALEVGADSGDGERRFRRKVSIDSGHGEHSSERSDGEPGGDALLSSSDSTGGLRCPSPVSSPVCVSQ